nr:response regulator [Bacteroidales bacterium]
IYDIYPAGGDKLLLGTNLGAWLVSTKNNKITRLSSLVFDSVPFEYSFRSVFDICSSKDNTYWVAATSGIFRVEFGQDNAFISKFYNTSSSPSLFKNNTHALLYDKNRNVLWAGTYGGGLEEIFLNSDHFPVEIKQYKSATLNTNGLSSNDISALHLDSNNRLWVGTFLGLNLMHEKDSSGKVSFSYITTSDGLPNNRIRSIAEDDNGKLWVATNGGLTEFHPEDNTFSTYKISDGIQSNEFSENAIFKNNDGELYFGGVNGITHFFPSDIKQDTVKPRVIITDFYLFEKIVEVGSEFSKRKILKKPIELTDSLFLKANENDIRFEFSALYYQAPAKTKYAYLLEGFDKEWKETDAIRRSATYTNLPYGNYLFKVKASNGDGIWSDTPTELFISVQTPFWLTSWFIGLYIILFILIVLFFANYSVIKIAKKNEMILNNEHSMKMHQLDMLRTRFFINVSHDLRTPVTLISGPLKKLLKDQSLSNESRKLIKLIERNAKRLNFLVEQLLDISKAESGKLKFKPKCVELNSFLREEASYFDYAFKAKGIQFSCNLPEEEIKVGIDKIIVSKIIFNLLSNALKYTSKGSVTLSSQAENITSDFTSDEDIDRILRIEIRDTGPGISEEKLPHIFERFNQINDEQGFSHGIGLSHCQDLINVHNGKIEVQSKVGVGSVFTLKIPSFSIDENLEIEKDVVADESKSEFDQIKLKKRFSYDSERTKASSNHLVLLIEDNADMLQYINSGLNSEFEILEATNGNDGIDLALSKSPDLIISDIMMPGMDGITLCKTVKTNIETSHIPVILLTARVDNESKFKGLEYGADDYISKPFDIEYLLLRAKNIISTREKLRSHFQNSLKLQPSEITVTSADEKFLQKLMAIIEETIPDSGLKIETIEETMGMSHANFYRKIKKITGLSGKELLTSMRLTRAEQLLFQE